MRLRLSNAPCSWGLEVADNSSNPPWVQVLGEISQAGYEATELGPLGYLPTEREVLEKALAETHLQLIAGTIFKHLHDVSQRRAICDYTHATCRVLQPQGATYMVVIDRVCAPRTAQAGQVDTADRLAPSQWKEMMKTITEVSLICREYGITSVLHPHAGTYIEYRDEVDRAMDDLDPELVKLCVDSGHSVYAGINPSELISTYGDRVEYLHFKDINGPIHNRVKTEGIDFYSAIGEGVFCPIGSGCVDFAGLRQALQEIGYDGWVTVEQDVDPNLSYSSLDNARESLAFIRDRLMPETAASQPQTGTTHVHSMPR